MPHESGDQPLAENRDFRILLSSQGVSALGDAVSLAFVPVGACGERHWQCVEGVLQAARSRDEGTGSGAISTEIEQCSQASSVKPNASTTAGSAHHGHSKVII